MMPAATGLSPEAAVPQAPVSPAVPRLRRPRATFLAALGLGVCAELLFDGPALGVSFPLFVLLLVGALLAIGGREAWQTARPNRWLLLPILFFSTMVFVRASPLLTLLNVLATCFLVLLLVQFWAAGRVQRLGVWGYPLAALNATFRSAALPLGLVRSEVDLSRAKRQLPKVMPVLRGGLLAVPVLFIFTVLLSSADSVFADALKRLASFDPGTLLMDATGRLMVIGGSMLGSLGLLAHALRRRKPQGEDGELEVEPAQPWLGFTECLTLVCLVNALFLSFAGIQLAFLFGELKLPDEFLTYSDYARRGFFQLLVVSLLALGLVMALARWTRLGSPAQVTVFRVGCSLMVGLVLVILASAMKRMALYEAGYGYTHLRLYTHVFMAALACVLAWRAVTLWWRPERFAFGGFLCALGYLVAMNVMNPDAFIARRNLQGSEQGVEADVRYVLRLSADAAPELERFRASQPESALKFDLEEKLFQHATRPAPGGWPASHLARYRAARLLAH
jgi:hypothetical protein